LSIRVFSIQFSRFNPWVSTAGCLGKPAKNPKHHGFPLEIENLDLACGAIDVVPRLRQTHETAAFPQLARQPCREPIPHGIHEGRGEKNSYDFFDLNVRGTFEVFEMAASLGINKIVFISTTSVSSPDTLYGRSKILAECIAEDYRKYKNMNVIILRPRAFIPFWNRGVYANYSDWARWFWKGAVHIADVASAVILSVDLISHQHLGRQLILTLDGAYEYTDGDLAHWDADGPGSTFKKYYSKYYDLARSHGLDPTIKPTKLDISETVRWLGYRPSYSLANLLSELAAYGDSGPPQPPQA